MLIRGRRRNRAQRRRGRLPVVRFGHFSLFARIVRLARATVQKTVQRLRIKAQPGGLPPPPHCNRSQVGCLAKMKEAYDGGFERLFIVFGDRPRNYLHPSCLSKRRGKTITISLHVFPALPVVDSCVPI